MNYSIDSTMLSSLLLFLLLAASVESRPNFIVCQPDDLPFFEEWTPPPHFPRGRDVARFPGDDGLPNIERLRRNSLQMMQAYTTSPMCGTSRYSTISGRYPSRSAVNRWRNRDDDISDVTIPKTKLQDVSRLPDGRDCSEGNLAAVLQRNGYRTGIVGKWHLGDDNDNDDYDYDDFQEHVQSCGFDYAEAVYAENLWHEIYRNERHSHNMEYMTERAINFIEDDDDGDDDRPFFMYFNPTVPHEGADVYEALTEYSCTRTPRGRINDEPNVPGMTSDMSCREYRQTVIDRAQGRRDNRSLGAIWLDDSIGALLQVLEDSNQLDNTFFLFQMDHGQEGKASLWEPGVRIAQFIHYPDAFSRDSQFQGMVSVIDIAPTILDYAGINSNSLGYYPMDGASWRNAVERDTDWRSFNTQRCLFYEFEEDRAVRCGCYKYLELKSGSMTYEIGEDSNLDMERTLVNDLCNYDDGRSYYETSESKERENVEDDIPDLLMDNLESYLECHLDRTRSTGDSADYATTCGPVVVGGKTPDDEDHAYDNDVPNFSWGCFPGEARVTVEGKGVTQLSSVKLGDKIMVSDGSYETVYSFGHYNSQISSNVFVSFSTRNGKSLTLTSDHMVQTRNKGTIAASIVQEGDKLIIINNGMSGGGEVDIVTKITKNVHRKGMYAPFTASGYLAVNDFVVSNYIALAPDQSSLVFGVISQQWIAHAFMASRRFYCQMRNSCTSEDYTADGLSTWVSKPLSIAKWLLSQPKAIQTTGIIIFAAFSAIMWVFWEHSILLLLAILLPVCIMRVAGKCRGWYDNPKKKITILLK